MPSFKDSNGREWSIRFDGLILADLRQQHSINLADLAGADYLLIERDMSILTVAVCHLCREQLKSAGVTREQFAASLVGQSIDDALAAIWEAAKVFFPLKRLSALQSSYESIKGQWEAMGPAMLLMGQPGIPPAIGEALTTAMLRGMDGTALPQSAANQSATGPAANPSNAATGSPAT